jgi:cell surface protein SprA
MNRKNYLLSFLLFFSIATHLSATTKTDTVPLRDRTGDYLRDSVVNSFNLRDPEVIEKNVEYDPATNKYYITEKIGDYYYRTPTVLTFNEYVKWKSKEQERQYFERLAGLSKKRGGEPIDPLSHIDFTNTQNSKLKMLLKSAGINGKLPEVPKLDIKRLGDNFIGMIFGDPPTVDIRPQGQIDLTLGGDYRYTGNPVLPEFARTNGGLLFNMDIQMNVTGKIGEKLNLNTSFNNKATFDFDNIMKLNYNSDVFSEDDIIKSIEGGNVSLPLRGSLIQGSQNLFGLKTELQFGHLRVTALAAQQRNRRNSVQVQGGAQFQQFNVPIDLYDENKHFFLTHFNRNTFEEALKTLPLINSQFSITKLEVWVSNERNEDKEVRQVVALTDLGEGDRLINPINRVNPGKPTALKSPDRLPDNDVNDLYQRLRTDSTNTRRIDRAVNALEGPRYGLSQGRDFMKRAMKRLQPSEYTYNSKLGTLSINNVERQQVVGVAFTYFYNGQGPFQVGEFAENVANVTGKDSISQVIFIKLLKSTIQLPKTPLFDLMMKNVYSVGAYVTNPQDLQLDIVYQDPGENTAKGNDKAEKRNIREIPQQPLLRLLNLDNLNQVGDPQPDGQFDFVPDVTINTRTGRIMFPVLEPFGRSLKAKLDILTGDPTVSAKYTYQALYDSTLFRAQETQSRNRFLIRGRVKSSASNRIQLNAFGLKPGAVTVSAGAYQLLEGVDYSIDYGSSTLTVLNLAYVAPNIPLNISYEDNALFGLQTRTMLGLRADYEVKKNFNIGATYMNLFEQPFTRKVNYGDDPIDNTVYGVDINMSQDAPWLTKLVDKIPLIDTKEPSKITFSAEAALLTPGHASAIEVGEDKGGVVYMDDFEGSSSPFSVMSQPNIWSLASTPQKHPSWREGGESIYPGINRCLLNWYRPDQSISGRSGSTALDIYVSPVGQTEVFPNRSNTGNNGFPGQGFNLATFDLTYYPRLRGPYNFDIPNGGYAGRSKGLDGRADLREPETRWAGIMRGLTTTDFEAANFEYIDTWILDPLQRPDRHDNQGSLIFHLGDVSEDILRDSRKMYENGLPSPSNPDLKSDTTRWGRVPRTEVPLPNSFSAQDADRQAQDVGLDGLNDEAERNNYLDYLEKIKSLPPDIIKKIREDPSNDNFKYYDDKDAYPDGTGVLQRYERFNGLEGNSASSNVQSVQSGTNIPDAEDVNRDNSFEENEAYYEYKIDFKPSPLGLDQGIDTRDLKYYVETLVDDKPKQDGSLISYRRWHHFRIPIDAYTSKYGEINDFRSIRFMRMIMKGFTDTSTVRFAKLDLIRNQWRRYKPSISNIDSFLINNGSGQDFMELNSVNVEENSKKLPFNYVLPPGILRENVVGTFAANAQQNEQSLSLSFKGLPQFKKKAAFKLFSMDMRVYERLKMFVHAENKNGDALTGKTCAFMRLGSDFENNFYEYELPLTMSDPRVALPTNSVLPPDSYREEVWRKENTFDFPLSLLTKAKLERNRLNIPLDVLWGYQDPDKPGNYIRIKGNPDIGLIKGVMFGVQNKDAASRDFEVWINELRLTGLNESAGGAALARVDFKLADFGNLSVSGNYLGIGYGAIDQRVQQRSREQVIEWGFTGNFELGKFLPQKSGIKVPFTIQYNNNTRTPEFDPYDLDLRLKDKVDNELDGKKRDSIKTVAQTIQTIKGFSFNNVRKERTSSEKKPMPWDIENFSASYGYTELERTDPLVESDARQNYKGSLDYNYSREPLYVQPFKNTIKNDTIGRYLKFITEFHFNPIPNTFGFNTIMDRQLNTTRYRFSGENPQFNTYFQRRFGWDRNYNMQWDFTRSLKLNYDAKTFAIIDELFDFKRDGNPTADSEKKDYLWGNIKNFGRTKRFDQNVNVNYTLPTRNIPFMDWVNVRATYGGTYGWEAFAYNPQNDADPDYRFQQIGNFVNNKQSRQLSADLNFDNLYNYSKYLKKIQAQQVKKPKAKKGETPSVLDGNTPPKIADNKADTVGTIGKKKKKKDEEHEPSLAERILVRPLLTLRKARLTYNEQLGSYVPGFLPQARLFGMQDLSAPGWDYALGFQQADDTWLEKARRQNWISSDYRQTRPLLNNYTQTIDARVSLEPFTDFRVDLDLTRNYTKNQSQEFRNTVDTLGSERIKSYNRFDDGSYTISYFTLNTLNKDIEDVYKQFINNSREVSSILGVGELPHSEFREYKNGYGPTNQDVLVPAFIAAYTGRDVRTSNRDLFKEKPAINWRLTYNGLAKLDALKKTFSNISITHGYKSTMTVSSFRTEPFYNDQNPKTVRKESEFEYYTQYNIPTLVIAEAFSPLIGIDVSLKSGANFGFQYKKSRNLALSVSDTRLQETKTTEMTFKFGHRLKNIYIAFLDFDLDKKKKAKEAKEKKDKEKKDALAAGDTPQDPKAKKKREPKAKKGNDLVLSFDVSLRDDRSTNRYITQDIKQDSRGSQTIRIAPSATYTVNKRLDLRFYVDYNKIVPYTTASFPTVTASGGFVITFKLN